MDYWFRSRNYLIVRYTLGRTALSIDTFIQEIETRKKNDLVELDKKLNDKKSEIDAKKNSQVKELKEKYTNEAKTKINIIAPATREIFSFLYLPEIFLRLETI